MKVGKFLKAANNRITEGSEFQWKCYPNGYTIDVGNEYGKPTTSCVYNRDTNKVYEIQVWDDRGDNHCNVYRWIDPSYLNAFIAECLTRNIPSTIAYDKVEFIDVDPLTILDAVHMAVVEDYASLDDLAKDYTTVTKGWPFPEAKKTHLGPDTPWPFPIGDRPDNSKGPLSDDEVNLLLGELANDAQEQGFYDEPHPYNEDDYLDDREDEQGAKEFFDNARQSAKELDKMSENSYKVIVHVAYELDVDAASMELAAKKGTAFVKDMTPKYDWPDGLVYNDRFVTKQVVEKALVTESYDEESLV